MQLEHGVEAIIGVHVQALYSAVVFLTGSSSKLRILVINLASVVVGQLVNSPTAKASNDGCNEKYNPFANCYPHENIFSDNNFAPMQVYAGTQIFTCIILKERHQSIVDCFRSGLLVQPLAAPRHNSSKPMLTVYLRTDKFQAAFQSFKMNKMVLFSSIVKHLPQQP